MNPEPEATPPAPDERWYGNARTYEHHRRTCIDEANKAAENGRPEQIREWRALARNWATLRDSEQARMRRLKLNGRL